MMPVYMGQLHVFMDPGRGPRFIIETEHANSVVTAYANSQCPDEPAHACSLVRTFVAYKLKV